MRRIVDSMNFRAVKFNLFAVFSILSMNWENTFAQRRPLIPAFQVGGDQCIKQNEIFQVREFLNLANETQKLNFLDLTEASKIRIYPTSDDSKIEWIDLRLSTDENRVQVAGVTQKMEGQDTPLNSTSLASLDLMKNIMNLIKISQIPEVPDFKSLLLEPCVSGYCRGDQFIAPRSEVTDLKVPEELAYRIEITNDGFKDEKYEFDLASSLLGQRYLMRQTRTGIRHTQAEQFAIHLKGTNKATTVQSESIQKAESAFSKLILDMRQLRLSENSQR